MNEALNDQGDDARAAWVVMRELVLFGDRRQAVAAAAGFSFQRAKALMRVAHGEVTHSDLAAELMIDKPYTTVIVKDLLERGLVASRPHPADGRSKLVSATPAGRDLAATCERIMTEPPPALRALGADDLAELGRILGRLAPG